MNKLASVILAALLILTYTGCTLTGRDGAPTRAYPRLESLPEDPCQVLSVEQVSVVTGLKVTAARRVASIPEIIETQREGREPGLGTICSYETESEFGAIAIGVPMLKDRAAANYWDERTRYFRDFPNAAEGISDLGKDAWIGGRTSLRVLLRDDEYFSVTTQYGGPQQRPRDVLAKVARAVLERF